MAWRSRKCFDFRLQHAQAWKQYDMTSLAGESGHASSREIGLDIGYWYFWLGAHLSLQRSWLFLAPSLGNGGRCDA